MTARSRLALGFGTALAWCLTLAFAFEIGGRLGFMIGVSRAVSYESVPRGALALLTLRELPASASPRVRISHERAIDDALIGHLELSRSGPSRFNLFPMPIDPCNRLPALATYRERNPSPSEDTDRLQLIQESIRLIPAQGEFATTTPACDTPSAPAA